jgi:hypothetical protein
MLYLNNLITYAESEKLDKRLQEWIAQHTFIVATMPHPAEELPRNPARNPFQERKRRKK